MSGSRYAEFSGDRTGSAPLTWGQHAIWKAVEAIAPQDSGLNVRRVIPFSQRRGPDVTAVVAALGRLVTRHESLRTHVRFVGGAPWQFVERSGRIPVEVVAVAEAGAGDLPPRRLTEINTVVMAEPAVADATEELIRQLAETPFRYAEEFPIRAGLVVAAGRVRQLVLVLSHVAADHYAADVLLRDLRLLLVRGELPAHPGLPPLDLARREGEAGRRTERALEHWREGYRRIPADQAALRHPAQPVRYHEAVLTSLALAPAVELIAAAHRVSSSTVYLAAAAAVFGAHTGQPTCGLVTIVNNRHQPGHAEIIAPMNQLGLFALDVPGDLAPAGLAAILPAASQAALTGYRHAYYDQVALDGALAGSGRGGALEVDPYSCFNDVRSTAAGPAAAQAGPAVLKGLLADTTLEWHRKDDFNWRFYLEIRDASGGAALALSADTRFLPPAAMERFVRALEAYIVAAALLEEPARDLVSAG